MLYVCKGKLKNPDEFGSHENEMDNGVIKIIMGSPEIFHKIK